MGGLRISMYFCGEVVFRHYGINQNDEQVFQGDRRVLIKKWSAWHDR